MPVIPIDVEGRSMTRISLEDARDRLADLIAGLGPGEEVQITEDDRPVARLVGEPRHRTEPRKPGSAVGLLVVVEDDDEHLEDFRDYMP